MLLTLVTVVIDCTAVPAQDHHLLHVNRHDHNWIDLVMPAHVCITFVLWPEQIAMPICETMSVSIILPQEQRVCISTTLILSMIGCLGIVVGSSTDY